MGVWRRRDESFEVLEEERPAETRELRLRGGEFVATARCLRSSRGKHTELGSKD